MPCIWHVLHANGRAGAMLERIEHHVNFNSISNRVFFNSDGRLQRKLVLNWSGKLKTHADQHFGRKSNWSIPEVLSTNDNAN